MKVENAELICPKCGLPVSICSHDGKHWYECSYCWTRGKKCATEEDAKRSLNEAQSRPKLQNCPNCGCYASINNRNHKYWYECNGCWTQSDKCSSVEAAREAWNSLKPRPKKTNFEVLQEMGVESKAKFLLMWAKNHDFWDYYSEEQMAEWLESAADDELLELAGM